MDFTPYMYVQLGGTGNTVIGPRSLKSSANYWVSLSNDYLLLLLFRECWQRN